MPLEWQSLWRAWDTKEHRSEVNSDYQSAKICSTLVNLQRSPDSQAVEMKDFLLYDRPEKQSQTPEQMLAMVELMTEAFGGTKVVNSGDAR